MKNLFGCLLIIFLFPSFGFCAQIADHGQPLTLDDCYKLALKQSELIAIDAEKIKEAEAHFLQAFGTLLPQVSFSRTDIRQDIGGGSSSGGSPLSKRSFQQGFVFTQVLFSGFKEFAAMSGSQLEKNQRKQEKLRAEQLLFVDVSDSFYLLLQARADLKALDAIGHAFTDRIKELKARVDIGRSRISEVVFTESQLYNVEADIELGKSLERIARELLEFLTGRPIDGLIDTELDFTLKSEGEYLAKAVSRPDVMAADFAWKLDQQGVVVARSGFFPTVNLEYDRFTHRNTAPEDGQWQALLMIDVPIFEGTVTFGNVKEAVSIAKESELTFQRTKRIAVEETIDAYANVEANVVREKILKKALQSAELNYKLQSEDYKLSVVNNLDVLTAIQNLLDAQRSHIQAFYQAKRFYWQLLLAAGEINVEPFR